MMMKYLCSAIALLTLFLSCSRTNYLGKSETLLSKRDTGKIMKCSFEEELKILGHNSEPWETTNYSGKGECWIKNGVFLKQDTLTNNRGRKYTSKTDYENGTLLYIDYGDTSLLPITEELYFEKIMNTARYSPTIILSHFIKNKINTKPQTSGTQAIYSSEIGHYHVKLFINTATHLVDKITHLSYDELYGDVTTTFNYSSYISKNGITYPTSIEIRKTNKRVVDNVKILAMEMIADNFRLINKPDDYQLAKKAKEQAPEIKISQYNDYIHFIDLMHTDDKVMVVELEDYVLVAEAPINSKNGELIISEVKKIAPSKPIKYFIFGHHHPHYLGGLRAFVHEEATILCTDMSKEYVEYIAIAPHTLQPDKLQLEPKPVRTQVIKDSLTIGIENIVKIYFMGEKSAHTKDFLIYYFPNEKLLFQDDLCWIPREGAITKAGPRQVGLYNFIKDLKLDVDTIIQSWPVTSYKVKTIIPFADIEESMKVEN